MEARSSGAQELRRLGTEVATRRHGVLETGCRCSDVEAWRHGDMELRRRAADLET